ncbi:MAG: lysylphosphatidylglycerol synthase transmembrane domain-containing protein [Marmoricola sp.]
MPAGRRVAIRAAQVALAAALVGGAVWTASHGVAGVTLSDVVTVLVGVDPWRLAMLAGFWFGGLCIYAVVLSAALPGLGVRRSLVLNLSGSAVANVIPLGGAVATALNWRMVRGWGHSNRSFVSFCMLTNAFDVGAKLVLPLVAVATLVIFSMHVPTPLWIAAAIPVAALVAILLLRPWLRRTATVGPERTSRWLARVMVQVREAVAHLRRVAVRSWRPMVPGSLLYVAAQVLLLYLCLDTAGAKIAFPVVLAAAAVERLVSLVPITPGGTGVAEAATVAWLLAAGADPTSAIAGVLLYRLFLFAMEIPVGGAVLACWALLHRTPSPEPAAAA